MVYTLRHTGPRHESTLLWPVGGKNQFTNGEIVTTTSYPEVVRALESKLFELVKDVASEDSVTADTENTDTPSETKADTSSAPSPRTKLLNKNR